MVLEAKSHVYKTAKIILKLSVCVFFNILLKTVILNHSTIWLLTPTLSKKIYYNMSVLCLYLKNQDGGGRHREKPQSRNFTAAD